MVMALQPGAVVAGRFCLAQRLGKGGMAEVWQAHDTALGRDWAIKLIQDRGGDGGLARRRFLREVRAIQALRHPNVVHAEEYIELAAGLVLVMELLHGENLRQRLTRQPVMHVRELRGVMLPVIDAIQFAHSRGIIHRDLKPENIFLCADGTVRVLDFGIAKFLPEAEGGELSRLTDFGMLVGTPYYMAPEQIVPGTPVDQRADIWAIGIMMYEALSGARPVEGATPADLISAVLTTGITPLALVAPETPPGVADRVMRMLARDVEDRLCELGEVRDALHPALQA